MLVWRYRLGVRTEDSQSSNPGSIPGRATKVINSLLPTIFSDTYGTTEVVSEKVGCRWPAPKWAFDFEGLTVSLKRYPDTKPFFIPQAVKLRPSVPRAHTATYFK